MHSKQTPDEQRRAEEGTDLISLRSHVSRLDRLQLLP